MGDISKGQIQGIDLFTDKKEGIGQESITGTIGFDILAELEKMLDIERLVKEKEKEKILGYEENPWIQDSLILQKKEGLPLDIVVKDNRVIALVRASREHTFVIVEEGYEDLTPLVYWKDIDYGYGINKLSTFMVSSEDALLATDVYLPKGEGPFPLILIRTPYGKEAKALDDLHFVKMGYGLVVQDVRGKFSSTGSWQPFLNEIIDGKATLTYLESQPWCNGNIGMIGASYGGYTGWSGAASKNKSLKALVSLVTAGGAFNDLPLRGGMLVSGLLPWALAVNGKDVQVDKLKRDDWEDIFDHRPLNTLSKEKLGEEIPYFNDWLEHEAFDDYWETGDWTTQKGFNIAPFIITGQFDDNIYGSMEALKKANDDNLEYRSLIGPWGHNINTTRTLNGFYMGPNSLLYDLDLQYVKWFDKHLRSIDTEIKPNLVYDWRSFEWKIKEGKPLKKTYWLEPNRLRDTEQYSGRVGEGCGCRYIHDPQDPAPSLINVSENELNMPADYSILQDRPDVLHFVSEPFKQEACLEGAPLADIYISSDCPDTDLVARLCLKTKDGSLLKLCETQKRVSLSYDFTKVIPLVPNMPRLVSLFFHEICVKIEKGEALVLQLCSAAKNLFFANHNTGNDRKDDRDYMVAHNTIHTGKDTPSRVTMFVSD